MRKSYNYEVKKKKSDSGKKLLGSGLRFMAGSGFDEYGSETLNLALQDFLFLAVGEK